MNGYLFEDLIIGEYQYIENGVEKVSTLNKLNIAYPNRRKHSISSNFLITQGDAGCGECAPFEKALRTGLIDEASGNSANMVIRRINVGNQQGIKVLIVWEYRYYRTGEALPSQAPFPGGQYTLLKQL